jgi:hypothetical protein
VLVAGFTRSVLERARFGPTTPTRARRPLRASVDPSEATSEQSASVSSTEAT